MKKLRLAPFRAWVGALLVVLAGLWAGLPAARAAVGDPDALNLMLNGGVNASVGQPDGKTILVGTFTSVLGVPRNRIARLNADGSLDLTFNPNVNSESAVVDCVAVQADGRVVIGGQFTALQPNDAVAPTLRNNLARLNADGTLDSGFNPNPDGSVSCLAVQRDGKVLFGGAFGNLQPNGMGALVQRVRIARVGTNGIPDSFNPGLNNNVQCLVLQADDKVLIGGQFSAVAGTLRPFIARLNAGGTLDASFNANVVGSVYALALQADGDVLLGGVFQMVGGVTRRGIARVEANGTLDPGFNPNPGPAGNSYVRSIAVQADGQVLLGGYFSGLQPGGTGPVTTRKSIARVTADGDLDPGFYPKPSDTADNSDVYSVGLQADGKVLVGGPFHVFDLFLPTVTNRVGFARVENDPALQSLTVPSANQVLWTRGGSSPECSVVTFELSTDGGATWTPLGPDPQGLGTRVGTTANWQLTGLNLSGSGQIRACGVTTGGTYNGSAGLVEALVDFNFPELAVTGNGADIADGDSTPGLADHTDFGPVDPASGAQVRTFIITNTGTAALTLGGFTVAAPLSPVAPGGSTPFEITFDPSALGLRSATVSFTNNDGDENPFSFSLQGTGQVPAPGDLDPAVDNSGLGGVLATAVQPDGKTIIAGTFTTVKGVARNRIARLNADHTLDSFNPDPDFRVHSLAVQADGQVLFGGSFTTVGGTPRDGLARVSASGALDPDFGASAASTVRSVALRADGKLLVAGRLLVNGPATQSLTAPAADQVLWTRGGTAPELARADFAVSTDDGATWSALGAGTRVGSTPDWQLTGAALPVSGLLRARGAVGDGESAGLVEAVADYGVPVTAEVAVRGKGVVILDGDLTPGLGDDTDFGPVNLTGGTQARTFTIANSGLMPLTLGPVTFGGAGAADFTVTAPPASPVAPNSSTMFQITFNPSAPGLREAMLSFSNNDPGENPYEFAIRGTGTLTATLPPPVVVNGADVVVAFVGEPGRSYRVQYLTGFRAPFAWADFVPPATFTAPTSGVIRHTDVTLSDRTRFYRTIPNP